MSESLAGFQDPEDVWVEVALGGGDEPVACDFLEDVRKDAGVGHPGKAGVAQVVAAQVFVAEAPGDVVPVGGVAQDCGADATAARAGVEAGVRVASRRLERLMMSGRNGSMIGMRRATLPLVCLSTRPPGAGVVCRRQVRSHLSVSTSRARTPETSPIRVAVQALWTTTSPHRDSGCMKPTRASASSAFDFTRIAGQVSSSQPRTASGSCSTARLSGLWNDSPQRHRYLPTPGSVSRTQYSFAISAPTLERVHNRPENTRSQG